jgi:glycosyltransferase involved in cell wall biosynthesis
VECLYAPFVSSFAGYLRDHASQYDLIYVTRYGVAREVLKHVREHAPGTKVAFSLADLHFLREAREAAHGSAKYTFEGAKTTREAELEVVRESDITLSYSDTELAVLESHLLDKSKLARLPWVVQTQAAEHLPNFAERDTILFVGGFRHPPNVAAATFFAREVMPLIAKRGANAVFEIVGSHPPVRVVGYAHSLDPHFNRARAFVAPLSTGAGLKGKVVEALARGVPCVLSNVALEGTGLADGTDALLAQTPQEWASAVCSLFDEPLLWERLHKSALKVSQRRFSFDRAREQIREILAQVDLFCPDEGGLVFKHSRPIE